MNRVSLDKLVIQNNRVDYYFSVTGVISKYLGKTKHMFLHYNKNISDVPVGILAIPFVANIMPLIWITDSTLYVEELDQSFYECTDDLKIAYQEMYPNVRFQGSMIVTEVTQHSYRHEVEAASLFSGGLDALTTFIRIQNKKPMLITEYAWHGEDIRFSKVWEADKHHVENFARHHGLENILIESNFGTFLNTDNIDRDFHKKLGFSWWEGLHHGLAIISAAIPVAYQLKVGTIYIASSLHTGHSSKCASDPTVDNRIRFGSGGVFHDAFELTRQDKVKLLADYHSYTKEPVQLRVCFKKEQNCCDCEKCLRTILGLAAEGLNPRDFGFDIPDDLSRHLRNHLAVNVKFYTKDLINLYWDSIQKRMTENRSRVLYPDLLGWLIDYDFTQEQKKALLHYRITRFFPIVFRKINEKISSRFAKE